MEFLLQSSLGRQEGVHRGVPVTGLILPDSYPPPYFLSWKMHLEPEREAKGSGPIWGGRPHPASSLELWLPALSEVCPGVYSPMGRAGVGSLEGGCRAATLPHWLLEASGAPGRKPPESKKCDGSPPPLPAVWF